MRYNAAVGEASVSENCCIGTRIAHALTVGVFGRELGGGGDKMKSKGFLRLSNRINYFDIDLEIVNMLILNQNTLAGENTIFKEITDEQFPRLSQRKNTSGSRKIILEHLRTTIHVSYIKEIYEEMTEYIQYVVYSASKYRNLDIKRFIGNNKIQLNADEVIEAGSWENITHKISTIMFKQLENERSTMKLIDNVNKKLNLKISDNLIENALPYLDMRHAFVHQNGNVDKQFMQKYPRLTYKENKIELTQGLIKNAKNNIIRLAQAIDNKMIENHMFPKNELQP